MANPYYPPDSRLNSPELYYHKRKPVVKVKIDWSHPLSKGLDVASFILNDVGFIKDLTGKYDGSITSPIIVSLTADGYSASNFSVNDFIKHIGYKGVLGAGDRTFIGKYKVNSPVSVYNATLCGYGSDGTGTKWSFRIDDTLPSRLRVEHGAGYVTANTSINIGDTFTAAHVLKNGNNFSFAKIYLNGNLDGETGNWSGSSNETATTINTASNDFLVAHDYTAIARFLDGSVYWYMSFSRALSDQEIKSLHDDPYQFLIPDRS